MAQIATVAAITGTGTAFAVNAQGVSRALKAGDVLQKGETIRTTGDVRVELLMEDGRLLAVAPNQVMRLDDNVTESDQRPTAQDSAVTTPGATADTVIQALERGGDLSTELEATAAGLGAALALMAASASCNCCALSKALSRWPTTTALQPLTCRLICRPEPDTTTTTTLHSQLNLTCLKAVQA